jgi:hypothetical protein
MLIGWALSLLVVHHALADGVGGITLGDNSNAVIAGVVGNPLIGGTTIAAGNLNYFSGSLIASATTGTAINLPSSDTVAIKCVTAGGAIVAGAGSSCGSQSTDGSNALLTTLNAAATEAGSFASYLAGQAATRNLGDVNIGANSKYYINVNAGLNIIQIGKLTTGQSAIINITNAKTPNKFAMVAINITGAVSLGDGTVTKLNGLLPPNRVIWNIQSANPAFGNASVLAGTFLNAPAASSSCSAGAITLNGALMCSGPITLGTLNMTFAAFHPSVNGTAMGANAARFGLLQALGQSVALASCLPSSSLSILFQGANVMSYVPKGAWSSFNTGISVVPVEGAGTASVVSTPNVVNSCSSNSVTGQTVCTANNTDVYLLSGSTLNNTLTSGGSGSLGFSGGTCTNCGVVVNSVTNSATLGLSLGTSAGYQVLNLANNTFQTPFATGSSYNSISEDVAVDPIRNLLLSPAESGNFEIVKTSPSTSLYENSANVGAVFDSGAEDCTTGIALATDEFTGNMFIADLSQAVYTAGTPAGTWTARANSNRCRNSTCWRPALRARRWRQARISRS